MRVGLLAVVLASAAFAQVPPGVRYLKAPAKVNATAKATLEKMFAGPRPALTAAPGDGVLVLGPFLGQRLARLDMSAFLKTTAVVPFGSATAQMNSYGARNAEERRALLALLNDLAPSGAVKVRAMSPEEMMIVWPIISWDLTEPVFVVESNERKWMVDFDDSGTSPFWIEDLTAPCFTAAELKGKCLCAEAKKVGGRWKLRFVEGRPCRESAETAKTGNPLGLDPSVADLVLVKFLIPDSEMGNRVTVEALGGYVKRLMAAATEVAARNGAGAKTAAVTVSIGVKPGGDHRVWVTPATSRPVSAAVLGSIGEAMRKAEAPETRGLIIFQLHVQLWGGPALEPDAFPDIPREWNEIVKREGRIDAETLVDKAWK